METEVGSFTRSRASHLKRLSSAIPLLREKCLSGWRSAWRAYRFFRTR